jgi:hypothetical protein|tara:strand:+ start:23 stop:358 length:336 start_codon:yes stop_codon:yes gene_type:complete
MGADIEGSVSGSGSGVQAYTTTHTWGSTAADGYETVTHNLGTKSIVVTVKEISGSGGGSYSNGDNHTDIGQDTYIRPTTTSSFQLGFDNSSGSVQVSQGDQFLITVMGKAD